MVSLFDTSIDQLFDSFFYTWPKQAKPPIERFINTDKDGEVTSFEIQMALAGYKEEDVFVEAESGYLKIKADNTKRENVSERFKSNISYSIPYSNKLDVEATKITLEDGLLSISIPIKEDVKPKKRLLFGKE